MVAVKAYRDMVAFGDISFVQLASGAGSRNTIMLRAGGVQLNAAAAVKLRLDNVLPFIDGWWTGMAAMEIDAYTIGYSRQFQFNTRNSDTPSVVHFEPSALVIGWKPDTMSVDQCIYSFSIRPTFRDEIMLLGLGDEPEELGATVRDRWGREFALTEAGWNNPFWMDGPRPWAQLCALGAPLIRVVGTE